MSLRDLIQVAFYESQDYFIGGGGGGYANISICNLEANFFAEVYTKLWLCSQEQ